MAVLMLGSGCRHQSYGDAAAVEATLPMPESLGEIPGEGVGADDWARAVDAPELEALIEQAYAGNFRWQAAFARIERAQAQARQAAARGMPGISANASAARSRQKVPSSLEQILPSRPGA
ncbi:MAG: hypothetical protein ACOCVG_03245, partial [Verrucomicrobiota bacterium]